MCPRKKRDASMDGTVCNGRNSIKAATLPGLNIKSCDHETNSGANWVIVDVAIAKPCSDNLTLTNHRLLPDRLQETQSTPSSAAPFDPRCIYIWTTLYLPYPSILLSKNSPV